MSFKRGVHGLFEMPCGRLLALGFAVLMVAACQAPVQQTGEVRPRGFALDHLAKADVDMVAEIGVRQSLDYLRELARKLYVRNPAQIARGGQASREAAVRRLFDTRTHVPRGDQAAAMITQAFDASYAGDRVAALVGGMRGMLLDGYGGKQAFYLHDRLDPQRLYYLARNFEIAFWKLRHDRDVDGRLWLLSDALEGAGDLSFARLSGKLIGLQDHMAQVVADSTNRQIKNVIQGVASMVFFPL